MAMITGTSRGETLRGTEWDDVISGRGGNDRIIGNEENDRLTGGDGRDVFAFAVDESSDTILDFQKGDRLELQSNGGSLDHITFAELDSNGSGAINGKDDHVIVSGGNLSIIVEEVFWDPNDGEGSGDGLTLRGVTSLSAAAFVDQDYFF